FQDVGVLVERPNTGESGVEVADQGLGTVLQKLGKGLASCQSEADLRGQGGESTAFRQRRFGPLALDKLANLIADGPDHLEDVVVFRPDFPAEKLQDAQDFTLYPDRPGEGSVQLCLLRQRGSGEVRVAHDVGDPGRFPGGPDA